MGGRGWRQSHGVPAGVVPPSGDSYFTICLTESTQTHPNVSHPSPDACARSHTGASEMDDRWLIAPPLSPHPPRPHTDSPRHPRQLPPSQRKDSGPTSGHNQQLRRSVRHRPTPPTAASPGKTLPRWNGARRSTFIYLTPRQGRDFICRSHLWLIIVNVMAPQLKDRPSWNLRGTEMTDGGKGPGHGQNTLVSKSSCWIKEGGRGSGLQLQV